MKPQIYSVIPKKTKANTKFYRDAGTMENKCTEIAKPEERALLSVASGGSKHWHKLFEPLSRSKSREPSPSALQVNSLKIYQQEFSNSKLDHFKFSYKLQINTTRRQWRGPKEQTFRSIPTTDPPFLRGPKL